MPKRRIPVENLEARITTGQKKFVSYDEAQQIYSLGRHSIEKLVKDSGARYRFFGRVLINTKILDEFLENCREKI